MKGEIFGYKIINLENIINIIPIHTNIVIAMANVWNAVEISKKLKKMGYINIYLYLNKTKSYINNFLDAECISLNSCDSNMLPSIELHVTDFCNLNCKGCVHFSPLFDKILPDFETRISDIYFLNKMFNHIFIISLLGGEPLLNPEIEKYIIQTRQCFPKSEIQIITNGLLLLQLSDRMMNIFLENRVTIIISEYIPTHKIIDQIEQRLQKFELEYSIRYLDKKKKFNRPLTISNCSKHNKRCISNGCTAICDGKIARCPTLLYIDKFNEKFKQNLPNEGIFNIRDCDSGKMIVDKLREKVPLCDFCIDYEIDWNICGEDIKIEDFAAKD